MRKQGFMKRVLGGIMAVAFGAALCFAAPVKAEAATPWTSTVAPNYGESWAYDARQAAESYANLAQRMVGVQQYAIQGQMWAQGNIMQTTAAAQQYLGALNAARQAASLVPQPYRAAVIGAIDTQWGALRGQAVNYINENLGYRTEFEDLQARALYTMQYAIAAQQEWTQIMGVATAVGVQLRQLDAYNNALYEAQMKLGEQYTNAYNTMNVALGFGGYNYGF